MPGRGKLRLREMHRLSKALIPQLPTSSTFHDPLASKRSGRRKRVGELVGAGAGGEGGVRGGTSVLIRRRPGLDAGLYLIRQRVPRTAH